MNITAKELSGNHLTARITIPFDGQQITGSLVNVTHEADIITESRLCSPDNYSLGRSWVRIELWGDFEETQTLTTKLNPNTPITIQEGQ